MKIEFKSIIQKVLSEKTSLLLLFLAILVFGISIYVFWFYGSWQKTNILDESILGQFGDFIAGTVGILVTFTGIVLYYVALTEQRKEIKINQDALNLQLTALNHQIEEFQAQKEELISTRRIYEQQAKTMKNQQFDSNFYNLLNVYNTLKNQLNSSSNKHDFFEDFYQEILSEIEFDADATLTAINEHAKTVYTEKYLRFRGKLSTYFKTIYRIIRFIHDCDHLTLEEKYFYSKVLRAQISDFEILVLNYNYQSLYGIKAQSYILKYEILKHIQRLSKIEFCKKFDLTNQIQKNRLILFLEWLIELINHNLILAQDIANEDPILIQLPYLEFNIVIDLSIDTSLNLNILLHTDSLGVLPFNLDGFASFINALLTEFFYLEKFKNIEDIQFQRVDNLEQNNITLKYTIRNI